MNKKLHINPSGAADGRRDGILNFNTFLFFLSLSSPQVVRPPSLDPKLPNSSNMSDTPGIFSKPSDITRTPSKIQVFQYLFLLIILHYVSHLFSIFLFFFFLCKKRGLSKNFKKEGSLRKREKAKTLTCLSLCFFG